MKASRDRGRPASGTSRRARTSPGGRAASGRGRWCSLAIAGLPGLLLAGFAVTPPSAWAQSSAKPATPSTTKPAPPKKRAKPAPKKSPAPTTTELQKHIDALLLQITELQKTIDQQKQNAAAQDSTLARLQAELETMRERQDLLEQQIPSAGLPPELEERLKRIESESQRVPELPADVVSAGQFPGSIRVPGTESAIKFGGRIRAAAVFTLGPLGTEDRFLTNSIPVEGTEEAGKGPRTNLSARASRLNFDLRGPTSVGDLRCFMEGDFAGSANAFRLRHAYAQLGSYLVGQTWSTFSDPSASCEDLDFEGVSAENIVRQPLVRYSRVLRDNLRIALGAEQPSASITGGQGVNVIPDLAARARYDFSQTSYLQAALVLRQIRGESDVPEGSTGSVAGAGGSLSGVLSSPVGGGKDRILFQLNGGLGTARYINDLNSLGGQDAVFDSTGHLEALPVLGWYIDYERRWRDWENRRLSKLRSSFIWSYVTVDNTESQPGDAYHSTHRLTANVVATIGSRLDLGIEYIAGSRRNKDGGFGHSSQLQVVTLVVF